MIRPKENRRLKPVFLRALCARTRGLFPQSFVVICLAIAGCGGSEIETVPVSGTVTLDGQPVANILVMFQPVMGPDTPVQSSPGAHGTTDEEGRYRLETADQSGAIVGEHVVTLVYKESDLPAGPVPIGPEGPGAKRHFKLPPQARDGSIQFTVPEGGTDQANFAFDSAARQPHRARHSRRR